MATNYPNLQNLVSGCFHQDCFLHGKTDAELLLAYIPSLPPETPNELRNEIQHFISAHPSGLLKAFNRSFEPDISIGNTDHEAKAWLEALLMKILVTSGQDNI